MRASRALCGQCPACRAWVPIGLRPIPGLRQVDLPPHEGCSHVGACSRWAKFDVSKRSEPRDDQVRWAPVDEDDPGMPTDAFVARLEAAGVSATFARWVVSPVDREKARAETHGRTREQLAWTIREIERIPDTLRNGPIRRRLLAASKELEDAGAPKEAMTGVRRPRPAPPPRVTGVVQGGLPTLGKRR